MSTEIATALSRFFDQARGPSHHELDGHFQRSGLTEFDPAPVEPRLVGKMKRVRGGLPTAFVSDPRGAAFFVKELIASLKATGCFISGSDQYPGPATIQAAQAAMEAIGLKLDASGELYPLSLGGLEGRELTEALQAYVRRIQRATDDAALTIGTAKDLVEAVVRHTSVESTGGYDKREGFPATVFRVCTAAGVAVPTGKMINDLDKDPYRALEQALILASLAINQLRHAEGTGHGRPHPTRADRRHGSVAAHAAAVVCHVLLPELAG